MILSTIWLLIAYLIKHAYIKLSAFDIFSIELSMLQVYDLKSVSVEMRVIFSYLDPIQNFHHGN